MDQDIGELRAMGKQKTAKWKYPVLSPALRSSEVAAYSRSGTSDTEPGGLFGLA